MGYISPEGYNEGEMTGQGHTEKADHYARRRARVLIVSAIFFIAMQATHFGQFHGSRLVDQVKISAWFVWSIALLVVLATGGGFFKGREVRALMNDESTRAHRAEAFVWGFWAAMAGAILLYGLTMIEPQTTARDAIHLILTFGVGVAILRFGRLEQRALKDG
jgi:cation transport ATPase